MLEQIWKCDKCGKRCEHRGSVSVTKDLGFKVDFTILAIHKSMWGGFSHPADLCNKCLREILDKTLKGKA